MSKDAVYLVCLDDGAERWQVIVFADRAKEAIRKAKDAYARERFEPDEMLEVVDVSRVKPPYVWLG